MKISDAQLKQLLEAAIFVAEGPLSEQKLQDSVLQELNVSNRRLQKALDELVLDYRPRGIQLLKLASGYRFVSMDSLSPWLSKLWQEQAPRYSRAMLETLSLIAYRQPITRGEIEDIRGVSVSSSIIKTLSERDWIKVIGHKEVPGRPALYATTKGFLDYFALNSLEQLPSSGLFEQGHSDAEHHDEEAQSSAPQQEQQSSHSDQSTASDNTAATDNPDNPPPESLH